MYFKVENNSLELTRIFKESFKDQGEREKKVWERRREIEMQRERKRRFGVNAIISHVLLSVAKDVNQGN